jgi:hypothetical protein
MANSDDRWPPVTSAARAQNVAFLVTCHIRTEKYIPLIRNLLDTFWPGHPPRRFFTDGSSQQSDDVFSFPRSTWVELLSAGLRRIRQERPQTKHVFHMLEDHCPLRRCDGDRLARIFEIAARHDLDAISFPTYPWPWHETDATIYPDGLVRTWRRQETIELNSELLAIVPPDFFRYFQVQPTLWRLDYLEAACAYARAQGVTDAWAFEAMRWPNARRHYVSRYDWPTVHHGFLVQGELNPAAIVYLDRERAEPSHRALVRDAIGIGSPMLFESIQMFIRIKRLIRRRLAGVKKWVTAKAR